ncbi:MAG TPA: patatin-like phospholipase family protein [Rubrivivax sp.]|nr:patatin-like phospholipase family protein [Rubrivivax sp.]HPO18029.1 patatin-like phospholipase family protein [Rubrivivax sp.]
MAEQAASARRASNPWREHERLVLVLQGGGALGAYQAGAYEAMAAAGYEPDWVTGVSIGAINATLIAGNPPARRAERLRTFWDRATSRSPLLPPAWMDPWRPMLNGLSFFGAAALGIPGFFAPRLLPPYFAPEGSPGALSWYDTSPLIDTLQELADFDLINQRRVRLSLGAVDVRSGDSVYFDNHRMTLRPEHVLASGALPPGFPPVAIDGEVYLDGGIASNSPLAYVLDQDFRMDALVFQVDVFSGAGPVPQNLDQVQERAKDIQFASKRRLNVRRIQELEDMRVSLHRLLGKLPQGLRNDPDVAKLAHVAERGALTLVHLINRRVSHSPEFKDGDFSRATVQELWQAGQGDFQRLLGNGTGVVVQQVGDKLRVVDLAS